MEGPDEIITAAVVGYISTPATGDSKLDAENAVLIKNRYLGFFFRSRQRRENTGGSSAYNPYFIQIFLLIINPFAASPRALSSFELTYPYVSFLLFILAKLDG